MHTAALAMSAAMMDTAAYRLLARLARRMCRITTVDRGLHEKLDKLPIKMTLSQAAEF